MILEFSEKVLKEIRILKIEVESQLVTFGSCPDFETYKYLLGKLEGLRLSEGILSKNLELYNKYGTYEIGGLGTGTGIGIGANEYRSQGKEFY